MTPNPVRGEALLEMNGTDVLLRPSFSALCAAEEELGPLFGLVERAAAGELRLTEMAALFWHCSCGFAGDRDRFSEALIEGGLAGATPALKTLLTQILAGR